MRLDHFFPAAPQSRLAGWRKRADAWLRRAGPSWRASPWRRVIQAGGLVLYLYLFFYVSWPYARVFSADLLARKEWLPVEVFLWLDPLVGLSTALAARAWNVALFGMAGILLAGMLIPRGFCGYLCPLGTLIDLFDSCIGHRIRALRVTMKEPWVNLRFFLLTGVVAASFGGVMLSGYVAAIPVVTRGLAFTAARLQLGLLKHWTMVAPMTAAVWWSILLFGTVLVLGLLGPRFWCRYLCPSGALLSLPGWLKFSRRHVNDRCIDCGKCLAACPFDAINPDFGTRTLACTQCQTCAGVCPTHAISFGSPPRPLSRLRPGTPLATPLSRRTWLAAGGAGLAAALTTRLGAGTIAPPLRPPGAVPEERFLDLCIRCEQCLQVCPGPVLQPAGLQHGWESLWTPILAPTHAGCHQDCNFCSQVCPTGAIVPLSLAEKRHRQIGLAVVDTITCLPHRGERDCQLCFDECAAAGYHAIEMREIQLQIGEVPPGAVSPDELEAMGKIRAPFVLAEACIGCGLCEYRCHTAVFKQQKLLRRRAIEVQAVPQQRWLPPWRKR